jgi:hypothetical protein
MRFTAKLLVAADDKKLTAYMIKMGERIYQWAKSAFPDKDIYKLVDDGRDYRSSDNGSKVTIRFRDEGGYTKDLFTLWIRSHDVDPANGFPVLQGSYNPSKEFDIDPEDVTDLFISAGFKMEPHPAYGGDAIGFEFSLGSYQKSENTDVVQDLLEEFKARFEQGDSNYTSYLTMVQKFEAEVKQSPEIKHLLFQQLKKFSEEHNWIVIRNIDTEDSPMGRYETEQDLFSLGIKGTIRVRIPDLLFFLCGKGYFNAQDEAEVSKIAKKIMRQLKDLVKKNPNKLFEFNGLQNLLDLSPEMHNAGIELLRKTIGDRYNYLNSREVINKINQETDHRKQRDLMNSLQEQLVKVLKQFNNIGGHEW